MRKAKDPPGMPDMEAVYDRIAVAWQRTRSGPWPAVARFLGAVARPARVIDVGVGSGRYAEVGEVRGLRVVGLDISRGQLALARRRGAAGLVLVRGDARSLPIKDAAGDAALCVALVHHFFGRPERVQAAREVRRVLRPGGLALLSAWGTGAEVFESARAFPGGGARDFLVPFKEQLEAPAERFFHAYAEGELAAEAREAGFGEVREWTESANRFVEAAR